MAVTNNKADPTPASGAQKPQKTQPKAPRRRTAKKKTAAPKQTGKMFQPTNDQQQIVMLAAAMGYSQQSIARLIINPENDKPISLKSLRKHFPLQLAHGRDIILMKIAGTMVGIATDKKHKGCVTAGIWLQKTWGRMREPEPEWSQRKREAEEAEEDAETGDIEIIAELVLEEPKPPALPAPTTIQ